MFQKQKLYKRLPGKKTTYFSNKKIYMAEDHLLLVENYYYTENYSRFYYKDIKAVIAQGNIKLYVYNLILILWFFVPIMIGFMASWINGLGYIPLVVFSVIMLIMFILNDVRGKTCKAYIYTDIQKQELPVTRLKTLRKIINRIQPLIEKYQGTLTEEELNSKIQEFYQKDIA